MKVAFFPAGRVTDQPAMTRLEIEGSQLREVHEDGRTVLQDL